jgi:hypothetical protein
VRNFRSDTLTLERFELIDAATVSLLITRTHTSHIIRTLVNIHTMRTQPQHASSTPSFPAVTATVTGPKKTKTTRTRTTTTTTMNLNFKACILLLLALVTASSAAEQQQQQQPSRALKKGSDDSNDSDDDDNVLWCKIVVFDVLYGTTLGPDGDQVQDAPDAQGATTSDLFYGCYPVDDGTVSDLQYTIDLPVGVVQQQPDDSEDDVNWWVAVPDGTIDTATAVVVIPDPDTVYTASDAPGRRLLSSLVVPQDHHSRRLASALGDLSVLVVYIKTNDAQPTPSQETVYETCFENEISLKWQYHHCSRGQLNLEPTAMDVLTVNVDMNIIDQNVRQTVLVNAAEELAIQAINDFYNLNGSNGNTITTVTGRVVSQITNTRQYSDLVLFIVPPGTGNWLAYASVGGGLSVFNDKWGIYLSAVAHEVGYVMTVLLLSVDYYYLYLVVVWICRYVYHVLP